jgi:hypothetical protein
MEARSARICLIPLQVNLGDGRIGPVACAVQVVLSRAVRAPL